MTGIYSKFCETVARRPSAVALRTPERSWSYSQLLAGWSAPVEVSVTAPPAP